MLVERNTTHGLSKFPEYSNWKDMLKRCFNPKNKRFVDYAERGISVHEDFIKDFSCWLKEIGSKPDGAGWSVGRIDNNEWYTYGNMRWETLEQQSRNHTKQKNNTSGVTGVKKQVKIIAGRTYTAWVASWNLLNMDKKTKRSKNFSCDKFGENEAFILACDYRKLKIEELNEAGAGYAESHGSDK